ncbi:hypothetical protein EJB05_23609, partial [Eragrostis curvula]
MTAPRKQPQPHPPPPPHAARPVARAPPPTPPRHTRHPPPPSPPPPRHQHAPPRQHEEGQQGASTSVLGVSVPRAWLSQRTPVLGLRAGVLVAAGAAAAVLLLLCLVVCLCRRCRRRRPPRLAPCPHRRSLRNRVHAHHQAMSAAMPPGSNKDDVEAASGALWRPPTFEPPIEAIKAEQKAPLILQQARGSAGTSGETAASGGGGDSAREFESAAAASEAGPEAARRGWGRRFSLREIEDATCGLAAANVIGEGGYGVVFRGVLRDNTAVAIKNLHNNRGQAEKDFRMEVATISRVRHKNLVSLLGYCSEGACRMLVYQYMDNSNLDKWLHHDDSEISPLTWDIRMRILLGTAKGYVAPEYAKTGMLNERSDVYSFGVLVMEIITGRTPVDYTRPTDEVNLVEWLKRMVAERRVEEVLDPRLPERPSSKALKRVLLAALRCVDPNGSQRPTMAHVVHMLEDDQILRDELKLARDLSPQASESYDR